MKGPVVNLKPPFSPSSTLIIFTVALIFCGSLIRAADSTGSEDAFGITNIEEIVQDDGTGFLSSEEEIEEMIELLLNNTRGSRQENNNQQEPELTLITFLQKAVKSYGQKKVARSIYELAQKDLYDLIWMLAGELDTYLIFDLYNVYTAAQTDTNVLSVYERFRAGNVNRTIVPEVFALDKKYDQFAWWQRVRGRMLNSVDKYMAGTFDIGNKTPPTIEYDKDGKVIIAGVRIPDSSTISTIRRGGVTRTTDPSLYEANDSDEDILDALLNL